MGLDYGTPHEGRRLWPRTTATWIGVNFADIWGRKLPHFFAWCFNQLLVALIALLAPEFIFAWALRQRMQAGKLAKLCQLAAKQPAATEARKRRRDLLEAEMRRDLDSLETMTSNARTPDQNLRYDYLTSVVRGPENKIVASAMSRRNNNASERDETRESGIAPAIMLLIHSRADWTVTHGFFIIMGGFHQFNGALPGVFLLPKDVIGLVSEGLLIPPSEEDIKDRGKADWFSKLIVLVQTVWFVMQYIARYIEHLPITELETVTLAYTAVIVAVYTCWWDKPLAATQPIRVPMHVWSGVEEEVPDVSLLGDALRVLAGMCV